MAFYNNDIKIYLSLLLNIKYNYNFLGIFSIIIHSITAPAKSNPDTIAISSKRYNRDFLVNFLLTNSSKRIPPLDIAKPYEISSNTPKGVKNIISGLRTRLLLLVTDIFIIELNTNPVENPEIVPIAIPITGMNITKAILRLLKNIPNSSISCIWFMKFFDNSLENDSSILNIKPR